MTRLLRSALCALAIAAPAVAQQAPPGEESRKADPPAVTLQFAPDTLKATTPESVCKTARNQESGAATLECAKAPNPPPDAQRHPDYGKPKQYPLSPA